jgi:hypothetical protein
MIAAGICEGALQATHEEVHQQASSSLCPVAGVVSASGMHQELSALSWLQHFVWKTWRGKKGAVDNKSTAPFLDHVITWSRDHVVT